MGEMDGSVDQALSKAQLLPLAKTISVQRAFPNLRMPWFNLKSSLAQPNPCKQTPVGGLADNDPGQVVFQQSTLVISEKKIS